VRLFSLLKIIVVENFNISKVAFREKNIAKIRYFRVVKK